MKAFVLLACTVVLAAATPSSNDWNQFKVNLFKNTC